MTINGLRETVLHFALVIIFLIARDPEATVRLALDLALQAALQLLMPYLH